jgi:hypothetical protein
VLPMMSASGFFSAPFRHDIDPEAESPVDTTD